MPNKIKIVIVIMGVSRIWLAPVFFNNSQKRGETELKETIYIIRKYWTKHIKNAAVLLFAGILMTIVIVVSFLQMRTSFNRHLHSWYDIEGMADLYIPNATDEFIEKITNDKIGYQTGYIYALGKTGIRNNQYTYGYIDDPYGLAHIPIASGRMPESDGEIAVDQGVLDLLGWVGNEGDTITLDNGTYTVVGIIDEIYGQQRYITSEITTDALNGDAPPYPMPLIYFCDNQEDEAKYRLTMINGLIRNQDDVSMYVDMTHEELGDDGRWCILQDKSLIAQAVAKGDEFTDDTRWLIILAAIAAVIAVLSVFSVLRSIFDSRKSNIETLRKIGMSKQRITLMYIIECIFFTIIQIFIGIILGIGAYCLIYNFQVNILEMADYSAFTNDILVIENTYNPYIVASAFSAIILITAYIVMGISSFRIPVKKITRKRPKSIHNNMRRIFRQRTVSIIQTISLTLICTGVLLGYAYYTDNGKVFLNHLSFFPETYEIGNGFDLKKDSISEYYVSPKPNFIGVQAYEAGNDAFFTADSNYSLGINDTTVDEFENVIPVGELEQTFIVTEEPNSQYKNAVAFRHEDEIEFIINNSKEEYKNFFEKGQLGTKNMYRISTKLSSENMINQLSQYVTQGSINIDNLYSGEEVLLISKTANTPFKCGEKLTIGSVASNGGYGIGDVVLNEVTIGAIVTLPQDVDKFLLYTFQTEDTYNFATIADGAKAIGLHNAVYTEMFAFEEIDGGLIEASAGMKLTSYNNLKSERFISKALEYGGIVLIVALMSLLGFAAYFSAVSMKINLKSYQISVLRALGMSIKKIRRKLFLSGLKIPVIACSISFVIVSGVQKLMSNKYAELLAVNAPDEYGDTYFDENTIERSKELISDYFLDNQLWSVSITKPLIVIFIIMCVITTILTIATLAKFKGNIAYDLSKERRRK